MLTGKTYWLVGASEGLGRVLALEMDRAGVSLVISARSKSRLEGLASALSRPARVIPLDVTEPKSVEAAFTELGKIDGIIYIAAQYEPMKAQNWQAKTSETLADVNFMGAIRVLGRITPIFAKRDAGHIVVIGSLSGYRGLPGALVYGASKAGLMHLAEAIQADLWKTRVKTQLFNLGFIETRLTRKNQFKMLFLMSPEQAANSIVKGMQGRKFKQDTPLVFSIFFRLSRLLPQFLYQRLFAK